MRKGIPLIIILFLLVLNSAADDFTVTWRDCEHGLTHHSCLVDITNLDPVARNFDLSLFFSDTSYPIEKTSASIYEWKGISEEFNIYDTRPVEKICYEGDNKTEATTPYDCSYQETFISGTEFKKLNQWKGTKAKLTKEGALIKDNYGLMVIPKSDSKPKYDDFGSVETTDGTKSFKVEWETPITLTPSGWGSSGKVGFFDDLTGVEYHPFWNLSYAYKMPINCSSMTDRTLLIINGSSGFHNLEGECGKQIVWTYCSGEGTALYYNDCADYVVANDSSQLPMDVELGNVSGYLVTTLYGDVGSNTAYHMDSSTLINDSSGNNDGTNDGAAVNLAGKFGSGLEFDTGGDDRIDTNRKLNPAEDISIYMWVLSAHADKQLLWGNIESGGVQGFYIRVSTGGNDFEAASCDGSDHYLSIGNDEITDGNWNMIGWSYNTATDTHKFFFNGIQNGSDWNQAFTVSADDDMAISGYGMGQSTTYTWDGTLDEFVAFDKVLTSSQFNQIYQNAIPTPGYGDLGIAETPPVSGPVNTSIYAAALNISDFSFSSPDYIEVATINFTTTVTKNLTFLSTFNIQKLTGAQSNDIWINITLNDNQILEEKIRTVTTNVDEGAVGTSPINFNLAPGSHNLSIYIKKATGNGAIEINDINAVLIQFLSTQQYNVTDGITTIDTTFSDTNLVEIATIPLIKTTNSSRLLTSKFVMTADATTTVACRYECLHTGEVSAYIVRYLEDSADVGNLFLTFIDLVETPSHNFSLRCLSTNGATVSINGTVLSTVMKDQNNNTIQAHTSGNISTNYSSTLTLTAGTHKLTNYTAYIQNGTGLLISGVASIGSNTGAQTPYTFINISEVSESQCYVKAERYLSDNSDIGNIGTIYLCDGLTVGSNYSVNLWLNVPAGEEVILYDEILSGFEITTFTILTANAPPIVAILEPAEDQVMDQDGLINWTITDLLGDRYEINITLWNESNSSQVAFLPDTEGDYTFNFSSLEDGSYNLTVEACENETADLFCSNRTIQITIATNLPPSASLNSPDDNGTNISIPPTLNVTVSDPNADAMNVTFYNLTGDTILCANLSIASGSDVYCLWPDLLTNTTYFWYVIVTDGTFPVTSDTWNFTTSASTTTTTTTTTISTTTTTLEQNLTGLMQIILDDRTMSEHKICIYQLLNWSDNVTNTSGTRPNLILCFNSPNTYLSQHSNSELLKITIAEDCDYIIKVQKQREDFLASPSNFLNGLLQNLGYLIMALIVVLSSFALWKKLT